MITDFDYITKRLKDMRNELDNIIKDIDTQKNNIENSKQGLNDEIKEDKTKLTIEQQNKKMKHGMTCIEYILGENHKDIHLYSDFKISYRMKQYNDDIYGANDGGYGPLVKSYYDDLIINYKYKDKKYSYGKTYYHDISYYEMDHTRWGNPQRHPNTKSLKEVFNIFGSLYKHYINKEEGSELVLKFIELLDDNLDNYHKLPRGLFPIHDKNIFRPIFKWYI